MEETTMTDLIPISQRETLITNTVNLWLSVKRDVSNSERTHEVYEHHMGHFRAQLRRAGYDLDGLPVGEIVTPENQELALSKLALALEGWASHSERVDRVGANTYNQRLASISSFYAFARKRRLLMMDNPVDILDRREVQAYASGQAMTREDVMRNLQGVDRSTLQGKRDYAILLVLLSTGRRSGELLSLQRKHLQIDQGSTTVRFDHCKGGKRMNDKLDPRVHQALLDYLLAVYDCPLENIDKEQYIWLSLSHQSYKKPLSQRGLTDIFKRRFHTSKVHSTRHAFALTMFQSGASLTDIQNRLGHSNVATTGKYLQSLQSPENPHISSVLDNLGIEPEKKQG